MFSSVLQTLENNENDEEVGRVLFVVVEYLHTQVKDETCVYEIASQSSIFEFIIKKCGNEWFIVWAVNYLIS